MINKADIKIDKLENKPRVYDKLVSHLLEEHYDIHKPLAILRNKRFLQSTFYALLHSKNCYVMYSEAHNDSQGSSEVLIGICVMICTNNRNYANVASVFIFPEHRHKGYAKLLLNYVEKLYENIMLWTYNVKYIPYYEKLGYVMKEIIQEPVIITYMFARNRSKI